MSKSIPKDIADRIKDRAKVEDFIPGHKKSGAGRIAKCTFCGIDGKGKGISISPAKQVWKCFSCGKGGKGAVSYVMAAENLSFPESLHYIADYYHIIIEEAPKAAPVKPKKVFSKKPAKSKSKSFCQQQLDDSGLTQEDIIVEVKTDDKTTTEKPAFRMGTRTQYGDIVPGEGDDMLIYYYDLDGRPVKYRLPNEKSMRDLIRVRWQNPMVQLGKDGNPIKYQSPKGSGSHLYIPEKIRKMYRNQRPIKHLFIQEGEKKAEKSCKHGIPSVGIMGINNLGSQNKFPQELQFIIQRCEVKQIVFLLDADWCDLSVNLKNGDRVDNRPRNFFFAVKNYKDYMRTLFNLGIKIDIWFGYVRNNEKDDKGIDDFLNGTLKGHEDKMAGDIEKAMNDKEGLGDYVQLHKITMMSDAQIADLWHLNDADKFAKVHKEELQHLQEFYIRKIKRRFNEEGELELDQPLLPDEQYWEEEQVNTKSGMRTVLHFDYTNCFKFLQNRGFWRIKMKSGEFRFVKIDNRVVEIVDNYHIKDFVTEFTKELKQKKDVLNMLYRGGPQYLGFEKLSNLEYIFPDFERAEGTVQSLFFQEKIWEISNTGINEIKYIDLKNHVWKEKIIDFNAEITEPLVQATKVTEENKSDFPGFHPGEVSMSITETGMKCDFLRFILNTSNFYWKKIKKGEQLTDQEAAVVSRHVLNKLTSMGYLLHDYKNDSELKAIIAMDGMLSEVGSSEGRTGKSIMGVAIEQVIPQVYIAAKSRKLTEDNFIFAEVSEKTKNIFLDDVRANVDFEFFFPLITGKLKVNPKGGQPFTLDKHDTPKLLISTNHAINGDGSSFSDRQTFMAFSDYYNDNHKPVHDFGKNFFSEWGKEQWNLFYNLMANSLMLYFRSLKEGWVGRGQGIIPPPMESLMKRRLRQQMGEDFLAWADEYFSLDPNGGTFDPGSKLNEQLSRKEVYDDLLDKNPNLRKYVTASSFSKRLKCYCQYQKYHLNPRRPNKEGVDFLDWMKENPGKSFIGGPSKSGGVEYITISNESFNN